MRVVERVRIVLFAASGQTGQGNCGRDGHYAEKVSRWRQRFSRWAWLAGSAPALSSALHSYQRLLAQRGNVSFAT
jgi:hypothetical protein